MVEDGVDTRCESRPRAALQRAVRRALPAEGGRRARALPRADPLRARRELPRCSRPRGGVRLARRGRTLALARGGARACSRRLQRPQPPPSACSRPAIRTATSASRPPGSSRSTPGCRRTAGRGRISPRAVRPSRGPVPTSASISRSSRAHGVRDVDLDPGRVRLRPRRDPLRHRPSRRRDRLRARHAARASAGAERRPRLHRRARRARTRASDSRGSTGAQAA